MRQRLRYPRRRAWTWAMAMGIEKGDRVFARNTDRIYMKERKYFKVDVKF